ncbi:hypothetical protein L227DRAFT_65007 [Lentinus tigrinus ALCF2SS1-6]|uniref:C2H2-type domain-containing protein n=1 Tax=Lentinus tigrinus ALCF2SS1-6 TaxID=1328759 RepID=A0A5C2SBS2_9APHY|nr:hypothetical protein L227DRAFT_65007 [Lentinus tigrinus ALCF2SS1-6]
MFSDAFDPSAFLLPSTFFAPVIASPGGIDADAAIHNEAIATDYEEAIEELTGARTGVGEAAASFPTAQVGHIPLTPVTSARAPGEPVHTQQGLHPQFLHDFTPTLGPLSGGSLLNGQATFPGPRDYDIFEPYRDSPPFSLFSAFDLSVFPDGPPDADTHAMPHAFDLPSQSTRDWAHATGWLTSFTPAVYTTPTVAALNTNIDSSIPPSGTGLTSGQKVRCPDCDQEFTRRGNMTQHWRSKHDPNPPRFPCPFPYCARTYGRRNDLAAHVRDKHPTPLGNTA